MQDNAYTAELRKELKPVSKSPVISRSLLVKSKSDDLPKAVKVELKTTASLDTVQESSRPKKVLTEYAKCCICIVMHSVLTRTLLINSFLYVMCYVFTNAIMINKTLFYVRKSLKVHSNLY